MEISPAAGKILGMVMAYAASSLGLLLAYYNYRKRIVKAKPIFSKTARRVIYLVLASALAAACLAASALSRRGETPWQAIRHNLPGIVIPVLIFLAAFWITWRIYRHFAAKLDGTES